MSSTSIGPLMCEELQRVDLMRVAYCCCGSSLPYSEYLFKKPELRRPGKSKAAFKKWKVKVAPAMRVLLMVHDGQARTELGFLVIPWLAHGCVQCRCGFEWLCADMSHAKYL